jgi:putative heme-binding domain-containing protein
VIDHLWHLVETGYYHRQGGPYPPFTWKLGSIVQHTHQKAAYCGLHYFDSDAYPPPYRGKLYMGNIHGGCINADALHRRGSTYLATPEPDLLTANDPWFMPVAQKTGPDGCLYILDWYDRYHCYQDANRDPGGIDRLKGRLYRLRYGQTPRVRGLDLAAEPDDRLLERLGTPNDFWRHTAQRLLAERCWSAAPSDPERVAWLRQRLEALALGAAELAHRRHALFTLVSSGPLPEATLLRLLAADDPVVRAWGVRAAGNQRTVSAAVRQKLAELARDREPAVQLQVAITAGKLTAFDPWPLWIDVLATGGNDPLLPPIVWQNLQPRLPAEADRMVALVRAAGVGRAPGLAAIVPRAIERLLAVRPLPAEPIASLWEALRDARAEEARQVLLALAERCQTGELRGEARQALQATLAPALAPLRQLPPTDGQRVAAAMLTLSWGDPHETELVRQTLADPRGEVALRLAALAALLAAADPQALATALEVLRTNPSPELAAGVLGLLSRAAQPELAQELLRIYPALPSSLQPRVIELLTQRPSWGQAVVQALAAGQLPAAALNVNQVQRLLATGDAALREALQRHWGTVRTTRDPQRERVVADMRRLLRLSSGDPLRGREVFRRVCAQCHRLFGEGQDVGPDLTLNGRGSLDQLVSNVFDPSLVIGTAYQARTVLTTDGRILTGLLVEDSPQRVVLKLQGGKLETIPRDEIDQLRTSELSLMPEGLEKQLAPQEIADLFALLLLERPPAPPAAGQP